MIALWYIVGYLIVGYIFSILFMSIDKISDNYHANEEDNVLYGLTVLFWPAFVFMVLMSWVIAFSCSFTDWASSTIADAFKGVKGLRFGKFKISIDKDK